MPRVFYSPDYVGAGYPFDTTRKAGWIASSLRDNPIHGIELVEPAPLTEDQVLVVHDRHYVESVRTGEPRDLAESNGFPWDENVWPMVLASNGGAVAAALAALTDGVAGSLSSGLHHARARHGAGFCTFNGLVIAADEVLDAGANSVLILDLDAHCGGGSAALIAGEPRISQIDVSVNSFDSYPPTERTVLEIVSMAENYLPTIARLLDERIEPGRFDICIYNAGMDPFEGSATGPLVGITREILAERERMVFQTCAAAKLPLAFVLAGGYVGPNLTADGLVDLHRLTIAEAARSSRQSGV
jgi:acetoin utilization deacetylase AcuC-like enzyme